jgi:hypothetical protein
MRAMLPEESTDKWWSQYTELIPNNYLGLIVSESQATTIKEVNCIIPGLLQTERYAHAAITAMAPYVMVDSRARQLIDVRMRRQWQTFEQQPAPKVQVLLDESVLHRCMGSVEIMREQLRHLLSIVEQPHITVQIIPFSSTTFHAEWLNFTIHEKTGTSVWTKVYTEDNFHGNTEVEGPLAVANYQQIFTTIELLSLSQAATTHAIEKALRQLESDPAQPAWRSQNGE